MSFTFDTSTNIGKVRTLIGDTDSANVILTDEEIQVFLDLRINDIYLSSADALRRMAADKAILEKKIKAGNYEEDPRGMSKTLRELAQTYEETAANAPAEAFTETVLTDFNYRTIVGDRALRGEE